MPADGPYDGRVVFSGPAEVRRSDLLDIVSVLEHDQVLERVVDLAVARTGARAAVITVLDGAGGPSIFTVGVSRARARALRQRLGQTGLVVPEDATDEPGAHRLVDHETGTEVLRVPIVLGRQVHADLLLLDPADGGFDAADVSGMAVLGQVASVAVRNALTYAASEQRREAAEVTARIDDALDQPDAEGEVLARVAEGAARISRADLAGVVRIGDPGTEVALLLGDPEEFAALLERIEPTVREVQASGKGVEHLVDDGHALVLVPLVPELARPGVVVLQLNAERASWTGHDRELLQSFADHGSLALDRAVIQHDRHRALLAADRDRIAQDMHDVVIQRLIATGLKLRAARRGATDAEELVSTAVTDLEESVRDIRSTIFELERGHEGSLRSELLALVREYEPVLAHAPRARIWGPVDTLVDRPLAEQSTAVLRELLSNCARHAEATEVRVDIGVGSGWLHLVVEDDGVGPGEADHRSGLRNLSARAERLGGWLSVDALAPTGTRVHWAVPLDLQALSRSEADAAPEAGAGTGGRGWRMSAAPQESSNQQAPVTRR